MKMLKIFLILVFMYGFIAPQLADAQMPRASYSAQLAIARKYELMGVVKELSSKYLTIAGKDSNGKGRIYRIKLGNVIVPSEIKPGTLVSVEYRWVKRGGGRIRRAKSVTEVVLFRQGK